MSDRSQLP